MNNKRIFLISLILFATVVTGCSLNNSQDLENAKGTLQDKGLTKLLSPEEYKSIIDEELAKVAREKLISPRSDDEIVIEEVEVVVQEIKNNCNLKLPESAVLPSSVEKKISKGYVCRYVKGGTATRGRIDNFTIKFFNENPFEFGIDDQINFPTSFGYLKFKDVSGNSLVDRQAKIITLSGEIYFESEGPVAEVAENDYQNNNNFNSNSDSFDEPVVGLKTIEEPNSNSKIYGIMPNDDGKRGKRVGCGDSLIEIGVNVDFTSSDKTSKIKTVLNKLLSIKYYKHSNEPLIINPLYNSYLSIESVKVIDKKVYINLVGELKLDGICDTPRFEAQIEAVAKQFGGIENVVIVINPLSEKDFF